MRNAALWTIASVLLLSAASPAAAAAGFQKISEHFYYLASKTDASNTGAIITQDGIVLIDPPPEQEVPQLLSALKAITSRQVRWVISTDYRQARSCGTATFLKLGASLIYSRELDRLAAAAPGGDPETGTTPPARPNPRFLFDGLLHLFPSAIEVRLLAIKGKARTAGDVVVFLPTEKVLAVGDFITPGSFPEIDAGPGEGSALGWIDGLKQVVDFVPLLKSAMPQPKQEANVHAEPEKSLEEQVAVIAGNAAPANLQQVKSLLSAAQKLRAEASRAVESGRSREEFLKLLPSDVFGAYGNLESFAGNLFDELLKK